jgi:hypothetical protein
MIKLRQKYKIQKIRISILSAFFLLLFVNVNSIDDQSNLIYWYEPLFSDALSQPECDPNEELERGKTPLRLPPTDISIDISSELKQKLDLKGSITSKEENIPICENDDGMYRLSTNGPFEIKIDSTILKDKVNILSDDNNKINSDDIYVKLEGKEFDGILQSLESDCSFRPAGSKDTIICNLPETNPTTINLNGQNIVIGKSSDDTGIIIISEISSPNGSKADIYACGESVSSNSSLQILPGEILEINCSESVG